MSGIVRVDDGEVVLERVEESSTNALVPVAALGEKIEDVISIRASASRFAIWLDWLIRDGFRANFILVKGDNKIPGLGRFKREYAIAAGVEGFAMTNDIFQQIQIDCDKGLNRGLYRLAVTDPSGKFISYGGLVFSPFSPSKVPPL